MILVKYWGVTLSEVHINNATPEQLNYAVGIEQGVKNGLVGKPYHVKNWQPTTDQNQCGNLITKYNVMKLG